MKKLLALVLALCMAITVMAAFAEEEPAAEIPTYTYHTYATSLGNNWNEHTWETSGDSAIKDYLVTPLADMQILDSENGVYQWVFKAATDVIDVTADHQDDLVTFGCELPKDKTAADVTEGYVYEIKLNPEMRWENGTPINADTYIYSMKALLDPAMQNYRANLYYAGESAVAGGAAYYYQGQTAYIPIGVETSAFLESGAVEDLFVDAYNFWGAKGYIDAEGNETPQYVSVLDETEYSADGNIIHNPTLYTVWFEDEDGKLYSVKSGETVRI